MSRLCLCLNSSNPKRDLQHIESCQGMIDMAEWRVDMVEPGMRNLLPDLVFRRDFRLPLILTARLQCDGGRWGCNGESEDERDDLLANLIASGEWDWVDIEYGKPNQKVVDAAQSSGTRIIRSFHDFSGKLLDSSVSELAALLRRMSQDSAIPKLAIRCTGSRQLLTLARLSIAVSDIREKIILGMDEFGLASRILAERFGSLWTYSSLLSADNPTPAAPGQLDPLTLNKLYRFRNIDSQTPLYAVAGNPIVQSRSPKIHNGWLQSTGLPGTYIPIRSDDIGALAETCDILGFRGLSITVPYKEKALSLCDYADYPALQIGATNTLVRGGDGWRARNTDAGGFLADLQDALKDVNDLDLSGKVVLVIGAGGAARAAVWVLSNAGAKIIVLNRTLKKAKRLAKEFNLTGGVLGPESSALIQKVDIAVQTTNVGMYPDIHGDPMPWWDFSTCQLVYDMIYEPAETVFLRRAKAAGVKIRNGAGMLKAQAKLQFKIFTGHNPQE